MKKMLYRDSDATYDVEIGPCKTGERISIYRTHDECWSMHCRGEQVARLTDHGNGTKIKLDDGITLDLDYAQVFNLKMLLDGYVLDGSANMGDGVDRYELKED